MTTLSVQASNSGFTSNGVTLTASPQTVSDVTVPLVVTAAFAQGVPVFVNGGSAPYTHPAPQGHVGFNSIPGPPLGGSWQAGDTVDDVNGSRWECTAGGTPGSWVQTNATADKDTFAAVSSAPISVLTLGAKGDVVTVTDAAITTGQATLSSTSANGGTGFQQADVGKYVQVIGAGAAFTNKGAWAPTTVYAYGDRVTQGGKTYVCQAAHTSASVFTLNQWQAMPANSFTLMAKILSVAAGVATLDTNAGTTVSGATCTYGTDDSPILTALTAGNYFFPGGRSYFLADWYLASNTTIAVGPGALFKIPRYSSTDVAVFRLLTSDRSSTSYLSNIHLKGVVKIDGTELTPPSGTIPRGVHVLNCQDWSIDAIHGVALPGLAGNAMQLGMNTGGKVARRGRVGSIRNESVRGVGNSCVQHTGGTQIEYGPLTCDGGLAFRCEMDNNATVTDNVHVQLAHATNDSGFCNAAVFFSAHTNPISNVLVDAVKAEGGADGSVWEYDAGGSISDCTITRMNVTGGGRATATSGNNLTLPGCTVASAHVDAAVATPGLRDTRGSLGGVGFAMAPGMTFDKCRATNCAAEGFLDVYQGGSVPAGSKITLINPEATSNTGPGIHLNNTEKLTVIGGLATDSNTALAPITSQLMRSAEYTGTLASWSTASGASAVSGSSGVLTVTAAGGSLNATGKSVTGLSAIPVTAGHFYKFLATGQVGTAPTGAVAQLIVWTYDAGGNFVTEIDGPAAALPSSASTGQLSYAFAAPAGCAFVSLLVRFYSNVNGQNLTSGWTAKFSAMALQEVSALPTQTYGIQADTGCTVDYFGTSLTNNASAASVGAGTITSH